MVAREFDEGKGVGKLLRRGNKLLFVAERAAVDLFEQGGLTGDGGSYKAGQGADIVGREGF